MLAVYTDSVFSFFFFLFICFKHKTDNSTSSTELLKNYRLSAFYHILKNNNNSLSRREHFGERYTHKWRQA